jgi:cation:H+ antiporter
MTAPVVDALRLAFGALLLYVGAESLVKGAAGLALAMRVRPFVVGVTVVAFGTSAPELTVSLAAALEGKSAITLGNVVGSNIANLGFILGATALISPPRVESTLIRREVPVLVGSALLVPLMLVDGAIGRADGTALCAFALAFTLWVLRSGRVAGDAATEAVAAAAPSRWGGKATLAVLALVGLAVLVGGGKVFVDGAVGIARHVGMSERVVGLTIVALGTSLPELAASLVAAARGHASIAVGNVVGSNIFNVLLILGVTGLVRPIEGSLATMKVDLAVMGGMTLLGAAAMRSERSVRRVEGAVLLAGYVGFLIALAR